FHWGLARIAHEMELNRAIYQDIRKGILYPAATQGREYRERAETALENGWWDEAVTNLQRALAENPMDFLAHYHLGHVLWFQHRTSRRAIFEDAGYGVTVFRASAALLLSGPSPMCQMQMAASPRVTGCCGLSILMAPKVRST